MIKLAVFVEGQTEQVFIEDLVRAVAGAKRVRIEKRKITGGTSCRRRMRLLEAVAVDLGQEYYVLIVDCGSYESVKSRIREEYDNLARADYKAVIALRDVYPIPRADIPRLRRQLPIYVKTSPIQVVFVLAVMEVEAWFLAEHTHFERIDPGLTIECIRAGVGFDPSTEDMEQRDNPAADLHAIYNLVGRNYSKSKSCVQRTVGVLDYARLYLELPDRCEPLRVLVSAIDTFLS
jgi:hypothetical protein